MCDMVSISDFVEASDFEWKIPLGVVEGMQVPVRVFTTKKLLENALGDRSIEQAINASCLPGLVDEVKVMPDVHQGYGFPIGGVAATRLSDGVISPGGIGYDINCGVRLMASQISYETAEPFLEDLISSINSICPSGVGSKSKNVLSARDLDQVCRKGSEWVYKKGLATEMDLQRTESGGYLGGADPEKISQRARQRGIPQLGTLGSGNHFLEVGVVDEIFNPTAADIMGLKRGYLTVMIHSGSRGLGHQVCTDYVRLFQRVVQQYGIKLPDRELVCAPLDSPEGKDYLAAMRAAANYAFANRQVMANYLRMAFEEVFAGKVKNWHLHQVYDITHNMGNIETHIVKGKPVKVCVHRKGATRAFGPGTEGLPDEYKKIASPSWSPEVWGRHPGC